MSGQTRRIAGRRGVAVLAVVCVALTMPASASAGWTKESITQAWFLSRPAIAVEADDDLQIVYERRGSDPGLFFTANGAGSWSASRITSGDHWGADVALDASGALHVAYASFGTDAGIHYLTNATGSWVDARLTTDAEVDEPAIALDPSGKVHIVYAVHGRDPGVYHLTEETGTWLRTRLASAAHDYHADAVIDDGGTIHVVWARFAPEAPGLYSMARTIGGWSAPVRLTASYDDWPSVDADPAGKVDLAFQRFGSQPAQPYRGQLMAASNALGSWSFERLSGAFYEGFQIGPPDVRLDGGGNVHIVVRESSADASLGSNPVLYHYAGSIGSWSVEELHPYVAGSHLEFPSLALLSGGGVRAAYRSFGGESAGIFLTSPNSAEIVATSRNDAGPSITSAPDGTRHLTFDRADAAASEHGVHYGDEAGGWSFERTQTGPSISDVPSGDTDMALAADGSVRIVTTRPLVTHITNENGSWQMADFCCGGTGGAIALDAAGKSHLAITQGNFVRYASNATGSWGSTDVYWNANSGDSFEDPAIAVDGTGLRSIFFTYHTPTLTPGLFLASASAGAGWSGNATRLYSGVMTGVDVVPDTANKLHVVWMDHGAAAGIYYATNRTGAWVRTRLSRSRADGSPAIGLDANGKVYVAFARGYWAASPGVYLVTDRTGAWQTSLVNTDVYASDPSLDIGPDGLADIAYVNNVDGVSILAQTDTAATSVRARGGTVAPLRGAVTMEPGVLTRGGPSARSRGDLTDPTRLDRHAAAP